MAQNLEDIERYVQSRVQELIVEPSEFQARLDQAQLSAERLVHEVKDLSKGNFLYTTLLVDGIATGELSLKNLSALPKTLNEVYQRFLRHRCPFRKWINRYQPILGTLTITQEPVSKEQLVEFTRIDSEQLQNALGVLQQFLDEINDEQGQIFYAIFHQSLLEYLLDKKHNHDFWCDPQEEHQRIIEHYYNDAESWDNLDWNSADNYGLLHLSKHLYAQVDIAVSKNEQQEEVSKYRQNLYNLICKSLMWAKLARFDSHQFFAEDVKLAIDISQAENPPNIVQQFRNSLVYATLGTLATNVPPEVIGALVRVGELRKAQGFAALVPDAVQRSRAWLQISEVAMGAVQKAETTQNEAQQMLAEIAKDGLTKALQVAETIQDEVQKAEMLAEVATALAQIDNREELHRVLEAAIAITDEEYRAKSLSGIAKALAQVGDVDALNLAFNAAEQIEQVISKVQALSDVSLALAQVGDNQKLRQVLAIVEQIERVDYKILAIRPISLALAKLGDVESLNRIREIIDCFQISKKEIIEEQEDDNDLTPIIQSFQSLNELCEGVYEDHEVFSILYKVYALTSLSLAMTQASEKERAIKLIDEALELERKVQKSKPTNKALMLSEIGTAVAQVGDHGCVFRLLNEAVEIDDDVPQDIMMSKIGLALAEAGNVEGVCQIIDLLRTEFFGVPRQAQYNLVGIPSKLEYWTAPKNLRFTPKFFDENKKIEKSRHEKLIAEIVGRTIESLTYTEFSEQFNQDSRYSRRFNQKPKYSHSGYLGWEVKVIEIVDEEYRSEIFAKQIINWASDLLLNERENVINHLEKLSASDQVKAIGKLAPLVVQVAKKQKSSELLYRLLTLAEAIEHPTLRRNALSKLALPFAQIEDKEVLQWLLTVVQIIETEQSQSEALSLLASNLAKLATSDALKQAILIAEEVKEDNFKRNIIFDVFSNLRKDENGEQQSEQLALISNVVETIKRPDYKLEILLNLTSHLNANLIEANTQNKIAKILTQAIN
ncbi:MAG: hypothetical protein PUP92_33295, partial [Rhizonema sp. PD38]|nr:hypothetical protein [Rhizonema sp. PD38]